jgi:glycerophosphoryl diester phosphodiesterase
VATSLIEETKKPLSTRLLPFLASLFFSGCFSYYSIEDLAPIAPQATLERSSIAHRGSLHREIPENSLPAITQTLRSGVQFAEVDVRQSTDGDLFLFHDGSIQTDNSFAPPELKGRKVQELSRTERAQVWLNQAKTISIPLLSDALKLLKDTPGTLQVDLKGESDPLLDSVIHELRRTNALSRVTIQLRSPLRIARIRENEPRARIVARCLDAAQLTQAIDAKVEAVELERWITADAIKAAHDAGVRVILNIASTHLDKPETWSYLRARGVDTIMSDHADMAR